MNDQIVDTLREDITAVFAVQIAEIMADRKLNFIEKVKLVDNLAAMAVALIEGMEIMVAKINEDSDELKEIRDEINDLLNSDHVNSKLEDDNES